MKLELFDIELNFAYGPWAIVALDFGFFQKFVFLKSEAVIFKSKSEVWLALYVVIIKL
jgi:hypothetical protein